MGALRDERSTGKNAPYSIGAQAASNLIALPCTMPPSFRKRFGDFWEVMVLVTMVVLNLLFPIMAGSVALDADGTTGNHERSAACRILTSVTALEQQPTRTERRVLR